MREQSEILDNLVTLKRFFFFFFLGQLNVNLYQGIRGADQPTNWGLYHERNESEKDLGVKVEKQPHLNSQNTVLAVLHTLNLSALLQEI